MGGDDSDDEKHDPIRTPLVPQYIDDPLRAALKGLGQEAEPDVPIPDEPFECTSEEDYALCLSPRAALNRFGLGLATGVTQMNRELEFGRVQGVAHEAIWGGGYPPKKRQYAIVPTWVWMRRNLEIDADFWDTGYLATSFPSGGSAYRIDATRALTFFDIRFWPDSLPSPAAGVIASATADSEVSALNKGGRPPKPWWEDLWVEICRQIYEGDLTPARQVDIENAMAEWITSKGHTASERLIRDRARKLFTAISAKGRN